MKRNSEEMMNNKKKKSSSSSSKVEEKSSSYEYCKFCKINHNQGRRHNYFPRHTNSLSSLFSRFNHKLSLINSHLSNPTVNHASENPNFWCIFCDFDVDNAGSSFISGNVIEHLASEEHFKNVKSFLWKYGGSINKLDSFRVTQLDLAKWKKKCNALQCEAASVSKMNYGFMPGQSNDIQPNSFINNSVQNSVHFIKSNMSKNVLPLQCDTNENHQVCHPDNSETGRIGPSQQGLAFAMLQRSENGLSTWPSTSMGHNAEDPLSSVISKPFGAVHAGVHKNQSLTNVKTTLEGYQTLTRISSRKVENDTGNIHSGAPPPWLEGSEPVGENGIPLTRSSSAQKNNKKNCKLNPKRVGAAWAEKRKRELEMERRGEISVPHSDPEWLPNFGRVWQSGSRKESIKEFKKEKLNASKVDDQPEPEIQLQPYVSKRMRQGINDTASEVTEPGCTS